MIFIFLSPFNEDIWGKNETPSFFVCNRILHKSRAGSVNEFWFLLRQQSNRARVENNGKRNQRG